jgi:hypothetical protein
MKKAEEVLKALSKITSGDASRPGRLVRSSIVIVLMTHFF